LKILNITTIGMTQMFFKSFIKDLVDAGHIVDIASNEQLYPNPEFYKEIGCKEYHLSCTRSPFSLDNIKCIKEIRRLVQDNHYDIVHCHTPIAAACTRIACNNLRGKGYVDENGIEYKLKVIYTAHGFHFCKGSSILSWLLFYPIEKYCSKFTDVLITINQEDYNLAKAKFESGTCKVEYVKGVGIDVDSFANVQVDKAAKRLELGIPQDAFLLLSVGELNENKNQQLVIDAIAKIRDENNDYFDRLYYVIAGTGPNDKNLQSVIDSYGLGDRIKLLGYRNDCKELYKTADTFIHPSYREGLPVSVMEAEAAGLNVIASNIRGNQDLVQKENLFDPRDLDTCKQAIIKAMCGRYQKVDASIYDKKIINQQMMEIYFG